MREEMSQSPITKYRKEEKEPGYLDIKEISEKKLF